MSSRKPALQDVANLVAPHLKNSKNLAHLAMTQKQIQVGNALQHELKRRRQGTLMAKIAVRQVENLGKEVGSRIPHRVVQHRRYYKPYQHHGKRGEEWVELKGGNNHIYNIMGDAENQNINSDDYNSNKERLRNFGQRNVLDWTRARHRALKHGSPHYRRRYKRAKALAKSQGITPPARYIMPGRSQNPPHWHGGPNYEELPSVRGPGRQTIYYKNIGATW